MISQYVCRRAETKRRCKDTQYYCNNKIFRRNSTVYCCIRKRKRNIERLSLFDSLCQMERIITPVPKVNNPNNILAHVVYHTIVLVDGDSTVTACPITQQWFWMTNKGMFHQCLEAIIDPINHIVCIAFACKLKKSAVYLFESSLGWCGNPILHTTKRVCAQA